MNGDSLAHLIMQILTVVIFAGTIGVSLLVGAIWRKDRGY